MMSRHSETFNCLFYPMLSVNGNSSLLEVTGNQIPYTDQLLISKNARTMTREENHHSSRKTTKLNTASQHRAV